MAPSSRAVAAIVAAGGLCVLLLWRRKSTKGRLRFAAAMKRTRTMELMDSVKESAQAHLPPNGNAAFTKEWLVRSEWLPNVCFHFKRSAMLRDTTLDNLLVVTDFDATLTMGKSVQCHDLVGFCPLLAEGFRNEFAPLLDWQSNTAIDGVEWWDKAHELMVKYGQPPRHLIPRMVRESDMVARPGALKLLERFAALDVPVLIVSAGVSDVIEEFLRQHSAWTENVTICSNRLNYAADSAPQSVSPDPPITSFTKATAYRASSAFFKQHADRSSILMMGDSCSDIDPGQNIPSRHLISVGFLNDKPMMEAAKYAQTFDALVLGSEGSLGGVDELLDDIEGGEYLDRS